MDQLEEFDELDEAKATARAGYKGTIWRTQIVSRILERARLLGTWLYLTVLPRYGLRALVSMLMITCGQLADAASFVVGIHILTGSVPHRLAGLMSFGGTQERLVLAAVGIASVLALANILGYMGKKAAVKLILAYQSVCFVDSLAVVRYYRDIGQSLSNEEAASITKQAPRMMARSVLQLIHLCTSMFTMMSGLVVCLTLFPSLTLIVIVCLVLLSPIYIIAALYSTNVGHTIRMTAPAYGIAINQIEKKWLAAEQFDRDEMLNEIRSDERYNSFRDADDARLTLPVWNHLLGSLTLALVVAFSFMWIAFKVDLTKDAIAVVVSYLISLRLFANGVTGTFSGVQSINTQLPFYLNFLMRDPRFFKSKKSGQKVRLG